MMRLLFVCQGNTCRSPMAEAIARHFGVGTVLAVSAGLRPGFHLADPVKTSLEEVGIEILDHTPQSMEAVTGEVDCVISLCEVVRPGLDLFPEVNRFHWRIPDPVGGSLDDYRYTRDLIWTHLRPLLARLLETDELPERLIPE